MNLAVIQTTIGKFDSYQGMCLRVDKGKRFIEMHDLFDEASIESFARQAISETVGDASDLTAAQRRMLLSGFEGQLNQKPYDYLAQAAVSMASFISDSCHPLRNLINGAKCYTELPFILRENDWDSDIAQVVREGFTNKAGRLLERNTGAVPDTNIPIDMNGIIDLAVLRDNEWTIVDYKTDTPTPDEDESAYIDRLKQSYSAQLNAYRIILSRLNTFTPVTRVFICALNLDGKLIELL